MSRDQISMIEAFEARNDIMIAVNGSIADQLESSDVNQGLVFP